MNRIHTFLSVLILCVSACETVVDIDVPHNGSKLVINGFFNPDSSFRVSLHQSKFILDGGDFDLVSGAEVVLLDEAGTELARFYEDEPGIYKADEKPRPGETYRIRASKPGLETATAEDMIPTDSAKVVNYELIWPVGELQGSVRLTFWLDDSPGKDYYELYAVQNSTIYTSEGDTMEFQYNKYFDSDDPVFDDFTSSGSLLFFDDALFNGKKKKITLRTLGSAVHCQPGSDCEIDEKFILYVRKVSKSYFQYRQTTALQRHLSDDPFAEPVSVFSNVQNGFGIFAGYQAGAYTLEVPDN